MKYTGVLKKPVVQKRMGIFASDDEYSVEAKRITDEQLAKLPELFDVHGIEAGDWAGLAIALAKAHVPGFNVVHGASPPVKWSPLLRAEFRIDVEDVIAAKGLPVVEAIKLIIRTDDWKDKMRSANLPTLENLYYTADLILVRIVRDARAYELIRETN